MYIDLKSLVRERNGDMFDVSPFEMEQTIGLIAGMVRDAALTDPEVASTPGTGVAKIVCSAPSDRLRERLAVLRWSPTDPFSDAEWFIDEPIQLPMAANTVVVDLVSRAYAEVLNLGFSPEDGVFEGIALEIYPAAEASPTQARMHVKLMAEQIYVSTAIVAPNVPVSCLAYSLTLALERSNTARSRAKLPLLSDPSLSTVGRWRSEFAERHAGRAGTGARWRRYNR